VERGALTSLCRLAEGQSGLFSAAQAAQLGISRGQLFRAASHGHLRRTRSGVYAFVGTPASLLEPLVAAALAMGPDAVVSHNAAACLHHLYGAVARAGRPELIVPRAERHHPLGVVIHRTGPPSARRPDSHAGSARDLGGAYRRVGAEIVGRSHRVASRSAFDQERRKLNALASAGRRNAHPTSTMSSTEILEAVQKLF
jgi:hypothetical protein